MVWEIEPGARVIEKVALPDPTGFDDRDKLDAFLSAFSELGTVRAAAEVAGIDRSTHYRWLEDPEYAEQFARAQEEAGESLEAEARRRAVTGWDKPVYHQGQQVGARRRYSDTLLIFLMKGAMPTKYVDRAAQPQTLGPAQEGVKANLYLPRNEREASETPTEFSL